MYSLCNDGTSEGAKDRLSYAMDMLPDCQIVRQPNSGLLGARNTLIHECKTRLSVFLDADDILSPRFLERTLEAYNSSPFFPDAMMTDRQNFGENAECVIRNFIGDHMHLLRTACG